MKPNQSNRRSRNKGGKRSGGGSQSRSNNPRNQNQIKQMLDKFNSQGRDARQSGDRVAAENFFQHAEHYQRMLNEVEGASGNTPSSSEANNSGANRPSAEGVSGNEKPTAGKKPTADEKPAASEAPSGNEKPDGNQKQADPNGELFASPLDIIQSMGAAQPQDEEQAVDAKPPKPRRRAPRPKKAAAE